ncbi:CHC2 zinc finger domain-containing protein [Moraxella marmotae]|uniref:CHC2 zinc finger domain-containing protein n=1 Tax=Moraxella marmotae TaxID=3344520 RepID=UPI0035F48495
MANKPPMGQYAPSAQTSDHNRHQWQRQRQLHNHQHQPTPYKPRYAHKVQAWGKDTSDTTNHAKNAQNGANTTQNPASFAIRSRYAHKSNPTAKKPPQYTRQRADLSRLPSPVDFYQSQGLTLKGGGVWRTALCPFHGDTHPSLSINSEHGGYICHVCGASGDMVGFYMQRFGVDFVQACKDLDLYR